MSGRRLLAVLLSCAVMGPPPLARGQGIAADSTAVADPLPFAADPDGTGELTPERQELEGVEALLGRADLADLAGAVDAVPADAAAAERRVPRQRSAGAPAWRLSRRWAAPGTAAGMTACLEGRQGPLRLLVRRRAASTGEVVWGGGLELGGGGGQVRGGTLGCTHGLGLLAAGGGRAATVAADASLAPGRGGVRLLSAGDTEGTLRGVSAGLVAGRWGLTGAAGTLPAEAATSAGTRGRPLTLARLTFTAARGEAALLICAGERAGGASFAASGRGRNSWYATEAATWREAAGGALGLAWAAAAGARHGPWLVEMQAAGANAGRGPPLGRPPPSLPGWAGCGWCVRAATVLGRQVRAQALYAVARERDEVDAGGAGTSGRRRLELALAAGLRRGWTGELRLRQTVRSRSGWDDRSPWLPPARLDAEDRTQGVATLDGALAAWKVRLAARGLAVAKVAAATNADAPLARGLVEARGERALGAGWSIRLAWAGAWGGAADLAACAAPAPGLALPRRWGGWTGERSVGCARAGRHWSLGVGCCLRRPADPSLPIRYEVWQHAALAW